MLLICPAAFIQLTVWYTVPARVALSETDWLLEAALFERTWLSIGTVTEHLVLFISALPYLSLLGNFDSLSAVPLCLSVGMTASPKASGETDRLIDQVFSGVRLVVILARAEWMPSLLSCSFLLFAPLVALALIALNPANNPPVPFNLLPRQMST